MIHIFNQRDRWPRGNRKILFVQLELEFLQKYLPYFRHNNSSDSLAVFMAIVGHMDTNGWCFPSHKLLHKETGIKQSQTLTYLISTLNTIILPMPEGPTKLLNYWSGRMPNGHMKSYYHVFPQAGDEDLAPEPHIIKELKIPGRMHRPKRHSIGSTKKETPSDEGVSALRPYMVVPRMAQTHMAPTSVAQPPINYNYKSLTILKPRTSYEVNKVNNIMPLSKIHLSVVPMLNKRNQRSQTFTCPHCQAVITQHHTACPDCQTEIVWTDNDMLARDARHAELPRHQRPAYQGIAGWLLAYAETHKAGTADERIFFREDKTHHEPADIQRFADLFGEQVVKDKAAYAVSEGAVGRGVIVTTLNLLRAHDPTGRVTATGRKTAEFGSRHKRKSNQAITTDLSAWEEQEERRKQGPGSISGA